MQRESALARRARGVRLARVKAAPYTPAAAVAPPAQDRARGGGIKTAGEKDWRALAEWLKLTFPENRQGHNINVSATANAASSAMAMTDPERAKLIEMRERALEGKEEEREAGRPGAERA